jgi:hypothetical protein
MSDARMSPPPDAWGRIDRPTAPTAGHAGVVVVSIGLAAALIVGGPAIGDGGLLTLLVLLLGCFGLVVPVAVLVTTWAHARPAARALLAVAGLACLLLLVLAVVGVAAVLPALL